MKFLSRTLAVICGLALGTGLVAMVADGQLLQPQAVIQHIPDATYQSLAIGLPAALAKATGSSADQEALLGQFTNPALLRQVVDNVVTTELNYSHGKGPAPEINLSALGDQLDAAGAAVTPQLQSYLAQPQSLGNIQLDSGLRTTVRNADRERWLGLLIALLAAIGIVVLAGHRRFRYLAEAAFVAAVTIGGYILVSLAVPTLIGSVIKRSPAASLAAPIQSALTSLVRIDDHELEVLAVALLVVMMVLFIAQFVANHRRPKHA